MGLFISALLLLFGASIPSLPIASEPMYLSASGIRAERALPGADALPPTKTDILSLGPQISAHSAIVVDASSGAVLFDKQSYERRPIASITKLMTALVFLERAPDLTNRVLMTDEDEREGGNQHIRPGESATLRSYLRASLVGSANNATVVLSRSTDLTSEEFVARMNEKAREFGMRDTVFIEPTGLSPENTSTARDLVRFLDAASHNETIREISGTYRMSIVVYPTGAVRYVDNTNHLIGSIISIIAGKTGYLDESLYNLASAVSLSNNREIYVIVLGAESDEDRVQDTKDLAVWAESTYAWE